MVAISRVIDGDEPPYGLFHVTAVPLGLLEEKGLRAQSKAPRVVHRLINRLQQGLAPLLTETAQRYRRINESTYPLKLSLVEQLSIAPDHYSAILLATTEQDAIKAGPAASEPIRKARALVKFARENALDILELVSRVYDTDTAQALSALEQPSSTPLHLLRVRSVPPEDDGYFSMFAEPWSDVNGLLRSYDRPEVRPEARALWFNGAIPFACLEVLTASSDGLHTSEPD